MFKKTLLIASFLFCAYFAFSESFVCIIWLLAIIFQLEEFKKK